jgi:small-conductance mechanosensitive channel
MSFLSTITSIVPYFDKIITTIVAIALIYVFFKFFIEKAAIRGLVDSKARYSLRKAITALCYLVIVLGVVAIWVNNVQTLALSFGLLAAGAAIVLQDVLRNFLGGIMIFTAGSYRIGDRIEVNGKFGDVIDIGMMYTTLMEIKEWVGGDQPSGRLSIMPNGYVLTQVVNNYTKDHNYIFEDITISLTHDSDWRKAADIIENIVKNETETATKQAKTDIEHIGEKYYLQEKIVEPSVYLGIGDNGVKLSVRYVTDVRDRRDMRDRIIRKILDSLKQNPEIKIASGL